MPARHFDWIAQAERDLSQARSSLENGYFEWACFISQQAGEKALKAVYQKLGGEARGHDLVDLAAGLGERLKLSSSLQTRVSRLSKHYIAARYPNAHAAGAPLAHYTRAEARQAINDAEAVLRFCKRHVA